MKNLLFIKKIFVTLIFIVLLMFTFAVTSVEASYKNTGKIYYNASFESNEIPSGYYNTVNTNLRGKDFKKNLYSIISKDYVRKSYNYVWEGIKYTDAIEGKADTVKCIYTGVELYQIDATNDHIVWNREHVWPKAHGFKAEQNYAHTDLHHIRASEKSINQFKSDKDFGDVDVTSSYSEDKYGNKWTNDIFEPRDEVKGDVARMIFYMEARYQFEENTKLEILEVDVTSSGTPNIGKLSTLIKWHQNDPVSQDEIYRNNAVYSIQKNRNPYIDHPEYVDYAYNLVGVEEETGGNTEETGGNTGETGGDTGETGGNTGITTPTVTELDLFKYTSQTYTVSSYASVTPSNNIVSVNATFNNTYTGNKVQMTAGNSQTLKIAGYDNAIITSITLSMKSNKGDGAGSLSIKIGDKVVKSIADSKFNTSNWNEAYTTEYVDLTFDIEDTIVNKNELIEIVIEATTNSLYCQSFTINYSENKGERLKNDLITTFNSVLVQSNMKFNYSLEDQSKTIVMSDVFKPTDGSKINVAGKTGTTLETKLTDDISLFVTRNNNSSVSNYEGILKIYASDAFRFESKTRNITKIVIEATKDYVGVNTNNVSNTKVSISGTTITGINTNPSNHIDFVNSAQTRIKSITLYFEDKVKDFSNIQLQFKYEFDYSKYQEIIDNNVVTQTGFILTDTISKINGLTNGMSQTDVSAFLSSKTDGNSKLIVNDKFREKNDFVYGINFANLTDCKVQFHVVSYIVVEGKYYFSNVLDSASIETICTRYLESEDIELSSDIIAIITDLLNRITTTK